MDNINVSWRGFQRFYPHSVSVFKVLMLIVITDLAVSVTLSFFISDDYYFRQYMKNTNYDEMVRNHYNSTLYVQPQLEAGWVNTPNYKEGDGSQWTTDFIGSRISPTQKSKDGYSEAESKENLVFLLGSSVIDGYSLPFEQTPAGYLNKYGYKAFDFGTSMYSIDQTFALYKNILSKHKPKVLVVGVHDEAEYVSNMFVPFRDDGKFTPFLKPAYHVVDHEVVKLYPPSSFQRRNDITKMLSTLEKQDSYYYKFQYFKRLSLLPFSDIVRQVLVKLNRSIYDADKYVKAVELQVYFMEELNELAQKEGAEVIFVKFENLEDYKKSLLKKVLTWFYEDKNTRHNKVLRDKPMNILYISDILKETGQSPSTFYLENDPVHLTPVACELLAKRIDQKINRLSFKVEER